VLRLIIYNKIGTELEITVECHVTVAIYQVLSWTWWPDHFSDLFLFDAEIHYGTSLS